MHPFEGQTALLCGASGFTGRYVRAALENQGCTVIDAEDEIDGFDLRNVLHIRRAVRRAAFDYVIHLAGLSFVANDDAAAFYEINTIGTASLLTELADCGSSLKKVIVASSANVYGNALTIPISESCTPFPVNHYACSKLAMEHMAATYSDRLPIVITRPFNYTGVGQATQFLIPKLVDHFARREPSIALGNLEVIRDFSDVRAIAAAYIKLLKAPIVGETINLCSGVGRTLRSVLDMLQDITGHSIEVSVNPALIRHSEVNRLVGDATKLTRNLGPLGFDNFRETLCWMLAAHSVGHARP